MHVADEFDDLDDDDLLSAAVHCGNGDAHADHDLSPRPNKRRRVHQDTSTTRSSLIGGHSISKHTQNGHGSHLAVAVDGRVQNGANGHVHSNAALKTRVSTITTVAGDRTSGDRLTGNGSRTRNFGKSTSWNGNVVTT